MDSGIQAKVKLNNTESEMHKDIHEIIIFKKKMPKNENLRQLQGFKVRA